MAEATFHFPRGFLWGTATASHQVEGNNTNNNWSAWEEQPGRILNGQKSGAACDWWSGRWREDLDRAAEAGQNAHRLSIEWSRVQPTPDHWDENALDRYRDILRGMAERNMTPMVTLHHFSDPLWLVEKGGWENEMIDGYFAPYVRKVVEALQEYTNLWVTINEPNVLAASGFLLGDFPPGKQDPMTTMRVMANMVKAHTAAYHAIHDVQKTARVGLALQYRGFIPAKAWSPFDGWAAGLLSGLFNDFFAEALHSGVMKFPWKRTRLPGAAGTQDFLGINYYTRERVAFKPFRAGELFAERSFAPDALLSQSGMIANDPEGLFEALKWGRQFEVPMIVTENGVDDSNDEMRPRYLIENLHQVWRAVNFNYPVKGYFHWTLVDNFEWERGWTQRFGLWELDTETQARTKRPSADLYADICKVNGISSETVARFAPDIIEQMFPN
ncbi:glycoside hydrolase family 1 protein [Chloroflexota bacterium]